MPNYPEWWFMVTAVGWVTKLHDWFLQDYVPTQYWGTPNDPYEPTKW